MRSIAFFNNKGGVGKTTLACNIAAYVARVTGLSVLVVDLDPQCNATQLLLEERQWDSLYSSRNDSARRTVLKVLKHIRAGDSGIDADLEIVRSERFGVDVLPGHPSLSMVEDRLSRAWGDFQAGDGGGARRSMWVANLVQAAEHDLVLFDVGPSLGALNRTVLLGAEGFLTPMAADLFSLYALDNISDWIASWTKDYTRGFDALVERGDFDPQDAGLTSNPRVISGWIGYTVQQYVTKAMGETSRTVNAYERYRKQIPERAETLKRFARRTLSNYDLGVVPNMFSMVPLAQAVHSPIRELTPSDGIRGSQASQQMRYVHRLDEISASFVINAGLVP